MEKIRWVHISDLHFGDTSPYSKESREQLLDYVKEKSWELDYIFITGDIIYAKKANEEQKKQTAYEEAEQYIRNLAQRIWKDSSDEVINKKIFIVPGNHDVIRDESREDLINGIKHRYEENSQCGISGSHLDSSCQGMRMYFSFLEKVGKKDVDCARKKIHYITKTDKANILHINTCIASGLNKEEGTLILGADLLLRTLQDIDDSIPVIVLGHHNIDCLSPKEQKEIELLLKSKRSFLYLCGHSHEQESNIILRYNQSEILNVFTSGTLMSGRNSECGTVFLRGELEVENLRGTVYSYKYDKTYNWTEDKNFGVVQNNRQENYRTFRSGRLSNDMSSFLFADKNGVISQIVSHRSFERKEVFNNVNKRAKTSLSVYGIGITHVSKDEELMLKILKGGGVVRLCMMDTEVLKNEPCLSLINDTSNLSQVTIKIDKCRIDSLRFCIAASHMNNYIREEYAKDVQDSYNRLLKLRRKFLEQGYSIKLKILRSFVPISLNIVNENGDDAELIAEYNMPFVSKRLLIHLNKDKNPIYYDEMKNVFEEIWKQAEEVQDEG